jgi:hypothetical protein
MRIAAPHLRTRSPSGERGRDKPSVPLEAMFDDREPPFDLPSVARKKVTADLTAARSRPTADAPLLR